MSVYFWGDTHFNHAGILRHTSRPWRTVKEMNEALIQAWNDTVRRESDIVYHLGDFGFSGARLQPLEVIWHRLRGVKHLLVGNHDERNPKVLKLPWESVEKLRTFKDRGLRAELCHYPLETWKDAYGRRALMIHGHSHGTLPKRPRRWDVGVDFFEAPVEWNALVTLSQDETYIPVDHRGRKD